MENIIYVAVAVTLGLVIILSIHKSRHPKSLEKAQARQNEVFDNYQEMDFGLEDVFREALQDGATHMKHAPQQDGTIENSPADVIAFYRAYEGRYEKRFFFLHERTFTKGAKWELNWRQCEELPQDSIPIPAIDYQHKEIDGMLGMYPDLEDFLVEANGDGATHALYLMNENVIKFYRYGKGKLEFRDLVFIPTSRWDWRGDWKKCRKMPADAIQISSKFNRFEE